MNQKRGHGYNLPSRRFDLGCGARGFELSIQPVAEILPVGRAAAFFIPGLGTLPNQVDFGLGFILGQGASERDFIFSEEPVVVDFDGVDLAWLAKVVAIDIFVTHDAAGYGDFPAVLFQDPLAF
jgi:hypothetical protein